MILYVNMLDAERRLGLPAPGVWGRHRPRAPSRAALTAPLWRNLRAFEGRGVPLCAQRALAAVRLGSDTNKPRAAASGGPAGTETASSLWGQDV